MFHYKAKFAMLILLLLLFQPIPTPTPALVQAEDNLEKSAQTIQALTTTLATFTPLMVLALGLFTALAAILIFGRKQNNIQPLLNSLEEDRKERNKLIDKLSEREKASEGSTKEAIEALAISNQKIMDKESQQGALLERMVANAERHSDILSVMVTQGSTPLRQLAARVDQIGSEGTGKLKVLQDSVNQVIEMIEKQDVHNVSLLTEIRDKLDKALETKIVEVEKRSTDSKPIPVIPDNQQAAS